MKAGPALIDGWTARRRGRLPCLRRGRRTGLSSRALAALRRYFVFRSAGNYRAMMKAANRFIRADRAMDHQVMTEEQ